jgi:hypothetical protein
MGAGQPPQTCKYYDSRIGLQSREQDALACLNGRPNSTRVRGHARRAFVEKQSLGGWPSFEMLEVGVDVEGIKLESTGTVRRQFATGATYSDKNRLLLHALRPVQT